MNQIDLHKNLMTIAFQLSLQSDGSCTRQGCIFLDANGRIISSGSGSQSENCKNGELSGRGSESVEKFALPSGFDNIQAGYFTHRPSISDLINTELMHIYYAHPSPSQAEDTLEWVNSKSGRSVVRIYVPEFMWLPIDVLPDGLYRCNVFDDTQVFQKSGPQMYRGITVFETSRSMLFQRVSDVHYPCSP